MDFLLKIRTAETLQAEQLLAMKASYEREVKAHLDGIAQLRKYDDARSRGLAEGSTRLWRLEDDVWTLMIDLLEAVEAVGKCPRCR